MDEESRSEVLLAVAPSVLKSAAQFGAFSGMLNI